MLSRTPNNQPEINQPFSFCGHSPVQVVSWSSLGDENVLVVPGAGQTPLSTVLPVLSTLQRAGPVTALGLPEVLGEGRTIAPEAIWYRDLSPHLAQVAHFVGYEDAVLVGYSYGGLVCLQHAARYPEFVRGVVIVDLLPDVNPLDYKRFVTRSSARVLDSRDAVISRLGLQEFGADLQDDCQFDRHVIAQNGARRFGVAVSSHAVEATHPSCIRRVWPYVRALPAGLEILVLRAERGAYVRDEAIDHFLFETSHCSVRVARIPGTEHHSVFSKGGEVVNNALGEFFQRVRDRGL